MMNRVGKPGDSATSQVPHGPHTLPMGRLPLAQALRAAAAVLAQEQPPAELEQRIQTVLAARATGASQAPGASGPSAVPHAAASSARQPSNRAIRTRRWFAMPWAWPAGAAATAVLLMASVVLTPPAPPLRVSGTPGPIDDALASGFVPVAGSDAWRADATGLVPAWLVPTEMPRERLGLLGLPYDPARAGETVRAELLMHGSGTVLAVRLVAP